MADWGITSEISYLRPPATSSSCICMVCKDKLYEEGGEDMIKRLPCCNYYFHRGCIKQWVSCNRTCPICRRAVPIRKKPQQLRGLVAGPGYINIRVSDVDYQPPRSLWVYQLMELIEALFFKGDEY